MPTGISSDEILNSLDQLTDMSNSLNGSLGSLSLDKSDTREKASPSPAASGSPCYLATLSTSHLHPRTITLICHLVTFDLVTTPISKSAPVDCPKALTTKTDHSAKDAKAGGHGQQAQSDRSSAAQPSCHAPSTAQRSSASMEPVGAPSQPSTATMSFVLPPATSGEHAASSPRFTCGPDPNKESTDPWRGLEELQVQDAPLDLFQNWSLPELQASFNDGDDDPNARSRSWTQLPSSMLRGASDREGERDNTLR